MTILDQNQQSAYDLMVSTLKSWGLSTLASEVKKLIVGGDTAPDTLSLALSQTDAYKQRFAGNAARQKNGMSELTPAQYIATEEQYRQSLTRYGLPPGFYDDKASTDAWIGGDVSPTEVDNRAQEAATLVYQSSPEAMKAWSTYYGTSGTGGAIAAILDPTKAAPLIQQQVAAAQIGGAAMQQGLSTSKQNAERFAAEGTTLAQAQKAYSDIAQRLPGDQAMASRFNTTLDQSTEESATIDQNAGAMQKQNTVYAEEAGLFGGHGGANTSSTNTGTNY